MSKKIKYLDYLFVLRPTLFFPVWTVFLAGFNANICFDVKKKLAATEWAQNNNPTVAIILLTLLMGAVFIINQLADIETDAKNQKIFFIATGIIAPKIAWLESMLLTILPISAALSLNIKLGAAFFLIFLSTGILYNLKPFSWKDKPILGICAHIVGGWSVAACGWIAAGTTDWRFCLYALPYAVALVSVYLLTTVPDIDGDRESGKITFGVKYGAKASACWALVFEVSAILFSFITKDLILLLPGLAAFPLFLIAAIKQKTSDAIRAVKVTILFASLAVCVRFPIYFLVIFFTYYFSRWYYRKRFNLEYPKFAA